MPVTFGAVQIVPPPERPAEAAAAAQAAAPQPPAAPDLGTALRHMKERAARVRAH